MTDMTSYVKREGEERERRERRRNKKNQKEKEVEESESKKSPLRKKRKLRRRRTKMKKEDSHTCTVLSSFNESLESSLSSIPTTLIKRMEAVRISAANSL